MFHFGIYRHSFREDAQVFFFFFFCLLAEVRRLMAKWLFSEERDFYGRHMTPTRAVGSFMLCAISHSVSRQADFSPES